MTDTPADPRVADPLLADVVAERYVVHSTQRFHGRVWDIRTDLVDLGDGEQVERDLVVHPGAVAIIAVDDDQQVLLVQQYRHPVSALLWEPPAGLLDVAGEEPLVAAQRELFEEAGYRASRWSVLLDVFMSPGGSSESVRLFLAQGVTPVAEAERFLGEAEERTMVIRWVPLERARAGLFSGDLHSPLCIMGILAVTRGLIDGDASTRPVESPWFRGGAHPS
ncbi:MAG TPA: NUDIX hydrolase [Acidothermaceae bacterium]|nr:NUDIX hydrolase [Acidothermaceae bacterium]